MNYFEFYDVPVDLNVDKTALKKTFYKNSKKYHPDFYTMESEEKQAEILEKSTLNNEAYQVLSDFDRRLKYLLMMKGMMEEEGQNNSLPQDFLMEMMDINEAIMELEFDHDKQTYQNALQSAQSLESSLNEEIQPIIDQYNDATATEKDLEMLKTFYLKKKYLLRIYENLSKFAPA